jgi:23S rRNA (uracil1939-C5)-methyltransferase
VSAGQSEHREVELRLDGIAHGGEALGRLGDRVVFVPFAIPGERVRVELLEEKPRWARARLVEVLEPSPDRIDPPCPHFGYEKCGGCQWQHIAYARQASLKQEIAIDQLRRLGHIAEPPVADIVVLAEPDNGELAGLEADVLSLGYRNQTHLVVGGDGRLGYHRARANEVIPIDRCLLLHERLDGLHAALDLLWPSLTGVTLRVGIRTSQALAIFEAAGNDWPELEIDLPAACAIRTPDGIEPLIGEPWLEERVAGSTFRISAASSWVANTTGAEALVEIVAGYLEAGATDCLLDAYCGVGLFAVTVVGPRGQVIGIEPSASACEDFAHNAGGRSGVELHEGSVGEVLPILREQNQPVDLAVVSPPATGGGAHVVAQLAALGPRRIVHVSCDSASLARDAVHFAAAGYHLVEAQPVDMYPQTSRVETVALWMPGSEA